jgi:hypothetical protein
MKDHYPLIYQQCVNDHKQWLDINLSITDIEDLSHELEKQYLTATNIEKSDFFRYLGISYAIAVLPAILASFKKTSLTEYIQTKKYISLFSTDKSIEKAKDLFGFISKLKDTLLESGLSVDSYSIIFHANSVLNKENQDLESYSLYDWFDLILEGEGISNVYNFHNYIYEWSILDVLPAARNYTTPKYICFFDKFIAIDEFLSSLTG